MTKRVVDIYLSGGAGNTDPNASLGGVKSTTKLYGQTISYDSTAIAGVTLVDAAGVTSGSLIFIAATKLLGFQVLGGAVPTSLQSIDISVDGSYTIDCPEMNKSVVVSVVAASLPVIDTTVGITAININQNLYANVLEAEALNGSVKYRHVYITNNTMDTIFITVYVLRQYTGLDNLMLGVFTNGSGHVDELLSNEDTIPTGVTFYNCDGAGNGLSLSLTGGGSIGLYLARKVTYFSDVSNANDDAILAIDVSVG
jgi:hypothetical protein